MSREIWDHDPHMSYPLTRICPTPWLDWLIDPHLSYSLTWLNSFPNLITINKKLWPQCGHMTPPPHQLTRTLLHTHLLARMYSLVLILIHTPRRIRIMHTLPYSYYAHPEVFVLCTPCRIRIMHTLPYSYYEHPAVLVLCTPCRIRIMNTVPYSYYPTVFVSWIPCRIRIMHTLPYSYYAHPAVFVLCTVGS